MNATPDTPEETLAEAMDLIQRKNAHIAQLEIKLREANDLIRRFMQIPRG